MILSGCNFQLQESLNEGIGYREARFAQISSMRTFRQCHGEALDLDSKARKMGAPAKYLASASLLEKCESELGPDASSVAENERMRSYALSAQNYLRGGNLAKSRQILEKFKPQFSGKDLYFADGSSFIESMEVLLSMRDRKSNYELEVLNIGEALKDELKRVNYWETN
jgi:hypothetical protein